MAITRVTNFTSGTLAFEDLNSEFNNLVNYINNRLLSNPLNSDLDFGDLYTVANLRTFWNIINVAEYSSLSAAESALPSSGGLLFVPPDTTIDISATVTFSKDNTWVVGSGPSSVLRRATGTFTASNNAMLLFSDRANCGVANLQLDGQQAANTASTGLCAVRVMGTSTGFTFRNNYVRRWGDNTEANTSPNDGILVGADAASVPNRVIISGNTFDNIRRSPIRIMNGRYINVFGNICTWEALSGVGAGVHMEAPVSGNARLQFISVMGNSIIGIGSALPTQGINLTQGTGTTSVDVSRIAIEGNNIDNTSGSGIHCDNAMLTTIVGNTGSTLLQSGTSSLGGIHLLDCSYMVVNGNILNAVGSSVSNSLASGILVLTTSNQNCCLIQGNILRDIAHEGIHVTPSGTSIITSVQILGNTVTRFGRTAGSASSSGIGVEPDDTGTIDGCIINNNRVTLEGTTPAPATAHGIKLEQTPGTFSRVVVIGNDLAGSTAGAGLKFTVSAGTIVNLDYSHNLEA